MPEPQPAPQPDYSWIAILIIAYLLLSGGVGGSSSPTKTIPDVPSVFTLFDDSPAAVIDLEKNHKGQYDVMNSTADDSIRLWVIKDPKNPQGRFLKYGTGEPVPEAKQAGDWAVEAYGIAKAAGKLPYTVASGPTKRGYSGPTPDGQEAAKKALAGIAK